ncbi:hypothetical protein D9M69_671210 [compost metagenome]
MGNKRAGLIKMIADTTHIIAQILEGILKVLCNKGIVFNNQDVDLIFHWDK